MNTLLYYFVICIIQAYNIADYMTSLSANIGSEWNCSLIFVFGKLSFPVCDGPVQYVSSYAVAMHIG